jgi:diaminopimelate decarboxylase
LINHYGREHKIGMQLREVIDKLSTPSVKYVAFDFHRHCQSLNWDRLALLKDELQSDIRQFGFFSTRLQRNNQAWFEANGGGGDNRIYQSGFFRTNCMELVKYYSLS